MSAAVLIPVLAAILIFSPPILFAAVISLISFIAVSEWFRMQGRKPLDWLPAGLLALTLPWGLLGMGDFFWGVYLASALVLLLPASLLTRGSSEERAAWVREMIFPLVVVAAPLGFFVLIRQLTSGTSLIFYLLITLWVVDSAAYFTGMKFGRTPMAPKISPGKTMEGLAGGLAAGFAAGGILGPFLAGVDPLSGAALGILLGILGQLGDLSESLWKRSAGLKDSGGLIPGHGGLLDRIDSFLLTTPAFYYAFRLVFLD
jgi:phosphatidate cytidylyltransferase